MEWRNGVDVIEQSESERGWRDAEITAPTLMRVLCGRGRCAVASLCWLVLGAALAGSWADAATTPHTCFTDRADEHHIEGEWTTTGYKAPYDECTDILGQAHNSMCSLSDLQATAGGRRPRPLIPRRGESLPEPHHVLKQFHATSCALPAFDATGFARVIGHGATLWFMGDSIMDQMISSLVCLMRAGGFAAEGQRFGSRHCYVMTAASNRSFRVCREKSFNSTSVLPTLLRFNHNAHQTAHQETVVVNFGLHYDQTDYGEVKNSLQQWRRFQPARKLRLVWRDTSPQHFLEHGGLFNRTTRNVTLPCVPIDDMQAAFAPYEQVTTTQSGGRVHTRPAGLPHPWGGTSCTRKAAPLTNLLTH